MQLAHKYQLLLDSGELGSQAALARYRGVSRARVTQVLAEAIREFGSYINDYNVERLHSSHGYLSPCEFELQFTNKKIAPT